MKKIVSLFLIVVLLVGSAGMSPVSAKETASKSELFAKKKKKFKGYKKPKSKKILGIFKRKSDCGCPNH